MTAHYAESLITVYSTPLAFDAELVKAMLADEEIPSFVEESNAPFPGLSATPCHVLIAAEHETRARQLIEEHEARHRERVEREDEDEPPRFDAAESDEETP